MPGNESRPQADLKAAESFGGDGTSVATDRRVYRRQHWAFPFIRKGGDNVPIYGSDAWLALPEDSPARVAACVKAAECWARSGDTLVEDLRAEVEESRRAFKQAEDAAYVARRDAHRKEWRHLSVVRSFPWNERDEAAGSDGAA